MAGAVSVEVAAGFFERPTPPDAVLDFDGRHSCAACDYTREMNRRTANERRGVDAGWALVFAFSRHVPRATHAGR